MGNVVLTRIDVGVFVAVAIAFILGAYLFFTGNHEQGMFAASWVPALLCFGIYFKLLVREK
jgi:hypothetical protein